MIVLLMLLVVLGLFAVAGGFWIVLQLQRQQDRLVTRLDSLATKLAAPAAAAKQPQVASGVGSFARPFDLPVLGGGRASLASLLAPAKPLLLIFTHPRCSPCYELLPDVAGWQRVYGDRVTIALISDGTLETNLAMTAEYGLNPVLLQNEQALSDAIGIAQMPAAFLISADGRIATEPSYGAHGVRSLVADTLGLAMPAAPNRDDIVALVPGDAVPDLRRPDLNGDVLDFASLRGAPTTLLFWSPGCTHCEELHPEILAFEALANRTRLVIVSRGPIATNQAVGFASTVLLDDDRSISRMFGVAGTPSALLIDSQGRVATPIARGLTGVQGALRASVFTAKSVSAAD